MNWRLMREALKLLRLEGQLVYRTYQRRVHFALALLVLSSSWKPWLRNWLVRLHYLKHAETPKLFYQPTPANEKLLAHCPVMKSKFHAPWYLSNGHLQTLHLAADMKSSHPDVHYQRQIVTMLDGGSVSLDWALPANAEDGSLPKICEIDRTRNTMLILPGLTGGSDEFYIRSLVHKMLTLGWQAVVLNARGCAGTPLTSPQLFSCAHTGDLKVVLQMFHDQYGFQQNGASLVAVGFSMGSNVLVKYLGEEQEQALVTAAVSVGNPFDMVHCSLNLKSSFLYRHTYYAALTLNLKQLFFHKSNAHEAFKDHPFVNLEALRNAKDIDEFDELLTCIVFGYKDAHEYYTDGSSGTRIPLVRVPLLCINAQDDPISTPEAIPYAAIQQNPNVILCLTKTGGHLAFYESDYRDSSSSGGSSTTTSGSSSTSSVWSVRAIAEYAHSFDQEKLHLVC